MTSIIKKTAIIFFVWAATLVPAYGKGLPIGEWEMVSYNFTKKIVYPIDKTRITLNVRDDGKLGGRSGCNVYGGNYAIEKGRLKVTDIISTMMACAEPSMQFERDFHSVLGGATSFNLRKGRLTITDGKTKNFISFKRVAADSKRPANGSR